MAPVAPKIFTYCICKFVFEFEGLAFKQDIWSVTNGQFLDWI